MGVTRQAPVATQCRLGPLHATRQGGPTLPRPLPTCPVLQGLPCPLPCHQSQREEGPPFSRLPEGPGVEGLTWQAWHRSSQALAWAEDLSPATPDRHRCPLPGMVKPLWSLHSFPFKSPRSTWDQALTVSLFLSSCDENEFVRSLKGAQTSKKLLYIGFVWTFRKTLANHSKAQ